MPRTRTGAPPASAATRGGGGGVGGKRSGRTAYTLTCANCRTRKIKCDGNQPECRICLAYGERCHYDKPPPMSQVLAMANRIKELERALEKHETYDVARLGHQELASSASASASSQIPSSVREEDNVRGQDGQRDQDSPYYQSTSAVLKPTTKFEESLASLDNVAMMSIPASMPCPLSAADTQQLEFWEDAAITSCSTILQMPSTTVAHLLRTHWTWVQPTFMFVSKSIFLRDAAAGGRYFSHLLLCVLCFHSTRFTDFSLSQNLLPRVQLLVGRAIHSDPSIPTVQALLQLSAREVGNGALSQAWLYSGIAFRMAVDLGIFTASKAARSDDFLGRGIREQLAWSCFLWDKAMSLYLGRAPVLPEPPGFEPPVVDDIAERATWSPYFGQDEVNESTKSNHSESAKSPPHNVPSHSISCFANFCKLALIINDILLTVYAKSPPADVLPFIQQTRRRLNEWRSSSPQHLIVEFSVQQNQQCYPPHILMQNILFHTTWILLHRPFRGSLKCRSICRNSAEAVENLLLLLDSSFGLSHSVYLVAYCAYTAATVAMLDMHDGVPGSRQLVNTCLRALYGVRTSCPSIQRSIDIILQNFEKTTSPVKTPQTSVESPRPTQRSEMDTMPAFLFDQCNEFAFNGLSGADALPFSELDSFAFEWSNVPNDIFDHFS